MLAQIQSNPNSEKGRQVGKKEPTKGYAHTKEAIPTDLCGRERRERSDSFATLHSRTARDVHCTISKFNTLNTESFPTLQSTIPI